MISPMSENQPQSAIEESDDEATNSLNQQNVVNQGINISEGYLDINQ